MGCVPERWARLCSWCLVDLLRWRAFFARWVIVARCSDGSRGFARCAAPLAPLTRPATPRGGVGVERIHGKKRMPMRVYEKAIEMNRQLAQVSALIERNDRDLLRQLKRAASSVALNIAEGLGTQAGNRELRFQTALGSAREVLACLEVAPARGYLEKDSEARTSVDPVGGMLFNLVPARPQARE